MDAVVNCWLRTCNKYVKLNMLGNGKAQVSSGWEMIVDEFKLQEGDICSFSFKVERDCEGRDPIAWLRLVITPLED